MSQANCLDPVIRTVDAVTQAERPGEKRIIVNADTRTAISTGQARQASALKYFLVSTIWAARCQIFIIYFGDTGGGRASGLRVEFKARCAEGREERVAEALCDDPSPSVVLVGKIRGWVREYVGQQPEAFISRFFETKGEIEARLAARALAETGLVVTAEISLCSEEEIARQARLGLDRHGGMPSETYETREEVEYHVAGHAAPFIVSNTMQLSVTDHETYLASGAPPLGAWLKESFEQVVRQTLPLLELKPVARDIRNRMSVRAAGIGCDIQQQPSITNGSIENWRNGGNLLVAATFETGLAGFRVGLRFEAVVVLTQAQDVLQYLARGFDLAKLMEQRALDEIRQTMLTLHPQRLYARGVVAGTPGEESWKTLLSRKVREVLSRDFDAEIISASVELTGTEFDSRLKDLRREPFSFKADIASYDSHGTGPFTFQGDCQIEDIAPEGWDKVWPTGLDVDRLRRQLSDALRAGMEMRSDLDLSRPNGAAAAHVRGEITQLITDYARNELGLVVKVSNVGRQPTEIEKKVRAAELANELQRVDLLHKLEERLIQLIANGGSDEEVAQVQKSLMLLRAYRSHDATVPDGADQMATTPEPDGRSGAPVPDDGDAPADGQPTTGRVVRR
jgi:hypothetical protein